MGGAITSTVPAPSPGAVPTLKAPVPPLHPLLPLPLPRCCRRRHCRCRRHCRYSCCYSAAAAAAVCRRCRCLTTADPSRPRSETMRLGTAEDTLYVAVSPGPPRLLLLRLLQREVSLAPEVALMASLPTRDRSVQFRGGRTIAYVDERRVAS
jgi:hypothetical protein